MSNYRPQGSEKIQDPDAKMRRILEIAGVGHKTALNEHTLNTKLSTVLHEAVAADGEKYGLIQEGVKVYLKRLVNERYEHMTGDEKDYAYKDYSTAFKQMNFLFKDISARADYDNPINIFEGGLKKKVNLKEYDGGEPRMTHQQQNAYDEPSEPEYDDTDGPDRQPSGIGNFEDYDWQTIHKEFVEASYQGNPNQPKLPTYTFNDFAEYMGNDVLALLKDADLIYYDNTGIWIDDPNYLDYDEFTNKARQAFEAVANGTFKSNDGYEPNPEQGMFGEGSQKKKANLNEKFVLKTPAPAPQVAPAAPAAPPADGMSPDAGMAPDSGMEPDAGMAPDGGMSPEVDQAIGDIEGQVEDPAKAIQKLTGKLTEKMRTAGEEIMTSEFMKSILNSVISAVDIPSMEDADLLSVINKLKGEENPEAAGEEGDPMGGNDDFTADDGNDYNVNNPANDEDPLAEYDDVYNTKDKFYRPSQNQQQSTPLDENMYPTSDDTTMPDILGHVISNIGVEINQANEEELRQAVSLFVNTYGGNGSMYKAAGETDFIEQLQDYVENTGSSDVNPNELRYSSLSPMGQQVFDQLELLDPTTNGLDQNAADPQGSQNDTNNDDSFLTQTSSTSMMAAESKSFLKDKIMEAINI